MHAVRAATRPKLSLAVPTVTSTVTAAKKPSIPTLVIPSATPPSLASAVSPLTPTARNTALNARGFASVHTPAAAVRPARKAHAKRVSFAVEQNVTLVSPCPQDYYGDYAKISREERRWAARS